MPIVVASLRVPQMPYPDPARYLPSWVEVAISLGSVALFALIVTLFVKVFPVVSVWEIREHSASAVAEIAPAGLRRGVVDL